MREVLGKLCRPDVREGNGNEAIRMMEQGDVHKLNMEEVRGSARWARKD